MAQSAAEREAKKAADAQEKIAAIADSGLPALKRLWAVCAGSCD